MEKIALYTIFRCTNYGAVLQAYALARVLREILGEDAVDVLNHRMDPRDNHLLGKISNPNTPWFQRWRNRLKANRKYVSPDLFETRRRKTIRFIDEKIRPTQHLYKSPSELRAIPAYKTVVVGSDQIWNPVLNHDFGMNQYLAECLPERQDRIAYAASFGVGLLSNEVRERYAKALSQFRTITVREETGADIVEDLLGRRPDVVLDPTMLLPAKMWQEVACEGDHKPCGDPVAYWVRTLTQADVDALSRLANSRRSRVLLFSAGQMPKLDLPKNVIACIDAAPDDFVRAVSGAEWVVTDSFHGLMFSTIFRRPVMALGDIACTSSNVSRLTDFCKRYGIEGAVSDINAFRRGAVLDIVDTGNLRADALASDIERSMKHLHGLRRECQDL